MECVRLVPNAKGNWLKSDDSQNTKLAKIYLRIRRTAKLLFPLLSSVIVTVTIQKYVYLNTLILYT